ncbi:adenylate cyclase protein, partial [Aureobasidium melanogenum]
MKSDDTVRNTISVSIEDFLTMNTVENLLRPWDFEQLALDGECPQKCTGDGLESYHERVTFSLDLVTADDAQMPSHELVVQFYRTSHGNGVRLPKHCAILDIGEDQGDFALRRIDLLVQTCQLRVSHIISATLGASRDGQKLIRSLTPSIMTMILPVAPNAMARSRSFCAARIRSPRSERATSTAKSMRYPGRMRACDNAG